jgi:Protein of unknown function (DUF3551)
MEATMRRSMFAVAVALVGMSFNLQPANAYTAPWCAVISLGTGSVYWDCQYSSFEQCLPNVLAGNRGFCNHNPYFANAYQPVERRRYRKH